MRALGEIGPKNQGLKNSLAVPTVVEQSNKIRNIVCPTGAKVPFSGKADFPELSNLLRRSLKPATASRHECDVQAWGGYRCPPLKTPGTKHSLIRQWRGACLRLVRMLRIQSQCGPEKYCRICNPVGPTLPEKMPAIAARQLPSIGR